MHNVTYRLATAHEHGEAHYHYLRLRKRFFVDELGWDVPHDDEVEMDQYDNPLAHYSLVLEGDRVIGGARTMPTSARWGQHTYMLRDALHGRLADIPASAMPSDVAQPDVWECTRLVVADDVATHAARSECLTLIVDGLIRVATLNGADRLISLSPLSLVRALRQLGYAADRIGEPYRSAGDGRRYAVLEMPAARQVPAVPRATHLTQPMAVHAAA